MLDPNMMKTLPIIAAKNPAMAKQMIVNTVRREGLSKLFKTFGPAGGLAFNQGGLLGFGTSGPMGMGIQQSMMRNPVATVGKLRFAMAFPGITGIGWLMDKFLPSGGERARLGATFGPRLADAASKLTEWGPRGGVQSHQEWITGGGGTGPLGGTFLPRATAWGSRLGIQGTPASRGTGILGGKVGPWLADLFGFDPITKGSSGGGRQKKEEEYTLTGYTPQGEYSGSSSAFPRGK